MKICSVDSVSIYRQRSFPVILTNRHGGACSGQNVSVTVLVAAVGALISGTALCRAAGVAAVLRSCAHCNSSSEEDNDALESVHFEIGILVRRTRELDMINECD